MTMHADATFKVKSWDESTYDEMEEGKKSNRASVTYTYEGDIVGESKGESLMMYPTATTSSYVGLERITGRLGGKTGSFVLQGSGYYDGQTARTAMTIIAGSGTGELAGIRGTAKMEAGHEPSGRLSLDYDFD